MSVTFITCRRALPKLIIHHTLYTYSLDRYPILEEEDLPKPLLCESIDTPHMDSNGKRYKHKEDEDYKTEEMVELAGKKRLNCEEDDDSEEEGVELDLDEAFNKAGRFGFYQKRLFFIICLSNPVAAYHILSIALIGLSPVWDCSEESTNFTTPYNNTDDKKCSLYEEHNSNCTPVYEDRFYSLTQEVHYVGNKGGYIHADIFYILITIIKIHFRTLLWLLKLELHLY